MGGLFGGVLVTMQVVGEMQARLEYGLLGSDEHLIAEESSAPAQAAPGWRRTLARALLALADRLVPAPVRAAPGRRLDPCLC